MRLPARLLTRRSSIFGGLSTAIFFSTAPRVINGGSGSGSSSGGSLSALPPLRDTDQRLYLIRHGETDWNVQNRIQGRTDNPLNANGKAQAEALGRYLASEPIDLITSSTLMRASQTCEAIAKRHETARRVAPSSNFVEMCFGDLEGRRIPEIDAEYKSQVAAWRAGENGRAWPGPGGESPNAVAARGRAGLEALGVLNPAAASDATAGRRVLVVAHGRFNKILMASLCGDVSKSSDLQQGNCCINVLDIAPDGTVVSIVTDIREHLEEAAVLT